MKKLKIENTTGYGIVHRYKKPNQSKWTYYLTMWFEVTRPAVKQVYLDNIKKMNEDGWGLGKKIITPWYRIIAVKLSQTQEKRFDTKKMKWVDVPFKSWEK